MKRVLATVAIALTALVALAAPAGAHAALSATVPAAGDVLDASPREIELRFTEPVQVDDDSVKVFGGDGERVETESPERFDGGKAVVVPMATVDEGGYVVTWKVVSADGHPIGGGFTFRVGDDAEAVDPAVVAGLIEGQTSPRAVGIAAGVVRFLVFAALLALVGGGAFVAFVWPAGAADRRVRRLLWTAWAVLLAGTAAALGLQGAELTGGGLGDALKPSAIGDVLDTTLGKVWLLRLLALLPVAWLLVQLASAAATWWRVNALVLGTVLVATPAFSGHADSGRWQELAKVLDILHVGAAAVWLGGLAVLLVGAMRDDDAKGITARFSPVAFAAVVVVVLTGTGQSIRQVTSLDAIETGYGRLLAVKIVIVLALIGIASLTRSALQGRLTLGDDEPDEDGNVRPVDEVGVLRRLVAAEVFVAIAVVVVTALLVDANPGYGEGSIGQPFDETVVVDDVLINVVAVPGTVGPTDFHVYVDNPAGGLEPPLEATGTLSLPGSDLAGIEVPFVVAGPSHWSATDLDVLVAGEWELEIQVLLTEVDRVTATFRIPIGGTS